MLGFVGDGRVGGVEDFEVEAEGFVVVVRSEVEVEGRACCPAAQVHCPEVFMMVFWMVSKDVTR